MVDRILNDYRSPFSRRHVDALDIETHYYVSGVPGDRPILFLHGMTSSGDAFREIMEQLGEDHWMIAPDLPGFGYSADTEPYTIPLLVEWLAAFCDALGLPEVTVVGHSFGGLLAFEYAWSYPEDVDGLVLIAPALMAVQDLPDWALKAGASVEFFGLMELGTALSRSPGLLERQIRAAFYQADSQSSVVWERRTIDYNLSRASAKVLKAVTSYQLGDKMEGFNRPTWFIWGRDDPVLPAPQVDTMGRLLPSSQLFVLPECGHVPMLEKTPDVVDILRAFMLDRQRPDPPLWIAGQRPVVSVFGGSSPLPGSPAYQEAQLVGCLLANTGYNVATGGYSGTMAAVSQGAAEVGGHVIGITSSQIEQYRDLPVNQWVREEIKYETLRDRLLHLVTINDAMIVLPGGIGTLSEMALAWSLLQVDEISFRPLVLLGQMWRHTLGAFYDPAYVKAEHRELLHLTDDVTEAVEFITVSLPRPATTK